MIVITNPRRKAVAAISEVGSVSIRRDQDQIFKRIKSVTGIRVFDEWIRFLFPIDSVVLSRHQGCNDIDQFREIVCQMGDISEVKEVVIYWQDPNASLRHSDGLDLDFTLGKSLSSLATLKNLRHVRLFGAVDDESMAAMSKVPALVELQINFAPITGAAFDVEWASKSTLRSLDLSNTRASTGNLAGLRQFRSLEFVGVDQCPLCTEDGIYNVLDPKAAKAVLIIADR